MKRDDLGAISTLVGAVVDAGAIASWVGAMDLTRVGAGERQWIG
jgi:hypothetical protein